TSLEFSRSRGPVAKLAAFAWSSLRSNSRDESVHERALARGHENRANPRQPRVIDAPQPARPRLCSDGSAHHEPSVAAGLTKGAVIAGLTRNPWPDRQDM